MQALGLSVTFHDKDNLPIKVKSPDRVPLDFPLIATKKFMTSLLKITVAHKYQGKSFKSILHNFKTYVNIYLSLVPKVLGN